MSSTEDGGPTEGIFDRTSFPEGGTHVAPRDTDTALRVSTDRVCGTVGPVLRRGSRTAVVFTPPVTTVLVGDGPTVRVRLVSRTLLRKTVERLLKDTNPYGLITDGDEPTGGGTRVYVGPNSTTAPQRTQRTVTPREQELYRPLSQKLVSAPAVSHWYRRPDLPI